jgi:hypothetical protein
MSSAVCYNVEIQTAGESHEERRIKNGGDGRTWHNSTSLAIRVLRAPARIFLPPSSFPSRFTPYASSSCSSATKALFPLSLAWAGDPSRQGLISCSLFQGKGTLSLLDRLLIHFRGNLFVLLWLRAPARPDWCLLSGMGCPDPSSWAPGPRRPRGKCGPRFIVPQISPVPRWFCLPFVEAGGNWCSVASKSCLRIRCFLYRACMSEPVLIIMPLGHVAESTGGVSKSTRSTRFDRLFHESTRQPGWSF